MKRLLRRLFSAAVTVLPMGLLRRWLAWSTRDLCLALCFHRVGAQKRAADPYPELTTPTAVLDELLSSLTRSVPRAPAQVFLCFDDGYADAAKYIASRAAAYPAVDWLFFVCPQKTEQRAVFRWNLYEATAAGPRSRAELDRSLDAGLDIDSENGRPELRRVAEGDTFQLATVGECSSLTALRNVSLGNHTNCHFRLTALPLEQARRELKNSIADFERLWGTCRHLAFPFGAPIADFTEDHVKIINQLRPMLTWSTQQRLFSPEEIAAGNVLPRLTVYQFGNVKAMLTKICVLATLARRRKRQAASRAEIALGQPRTGAPDASTGPQQAGARNEALTF